MNQSTVTSKRTPLFDTHKSLGAKLIEFGGWSMPVDYGSITEEHLAVRTAAGLFDVSHMGEIDSLFSIRLQKLCKQSDTTSP